MRPLGKEDEPSLDDRPYTHNTRIHRFMSWLSHTFFSTNIYTVRHGLLTGIKRKGGLGFLPRWLSGCTETAESLFLSAIDYRGKIVYDIGAFHGLFTLFFAKTAKQVICYEPQTKNYVRLLENLALNNVDNVTVRQIGIGSKKGIYRMAWIPNVIGGASVEQAIVEQILQSSSVAETALVQITTLDSDITERQLPIPDFIKIDIEGFEIEALRGSTSILETYRPLLFLEMHGETINEKRRKVHEIVEFLEKYNYKSITHIETNMRITSQNADVACQGHLYCCHEA